ncbi:MAG: carboxypeptidase-like regulatory domain-containing protein [Vicinamibacterales bacterium]
MRDQQGGALPGVTVTATSPDLISPSTATTNEEGYYRLINLPPGRYQVTAELAGFTPAVHQDILLRAGATFAVDVVLSLGTLQETVTVSGDSPMVEVLRTGNVMNIDGDFQKAMPLQARRNWSDFLELTPGIISRGFDDGSGRQVCSATPRNTSRTCCSSKGMIASSSRRPGHLRLHGRRHDPGHPEQDRRRGRLCTDGRGHGDQCHHQERWQPVQRVRRLRLPAVFVER